jgi:hypothetical protein
MHIGIFIVQALRNAPTPLQPPFTVEQVLDALEDADWVLRGDRHDVMSVCDGSRVGEALGLCRRVYHEALFEVGVA